MISRLLCSIRDFTNKEELYLMAPLCLYVMGLEIT